MNPNKFAHRNLKVGHRGPDVKELQQGLNHLYDHFKIDYHVKEDGEYGKHTKKATLLGEYVIGLSKAIRHQTRHEGLTTYAQQVLRGSRNSTPAMAIRRLHRRKHIRRIRRKSHKPASGVATFDGVPVAAWMVVWLQKARKNGWGGRLVSGYRTPEYSQSLCYGICGAPSCPGLCAGVASNHSGKEYPAGAVDVTDYNTFENLQSRIGSPLVNHLPSDPVHFSVSGY
jgi:hypothetical protein